MQLNRKEWSLLFPQHSYGAALTKDQLETGLAKGADKLPPERLRALHEAMLDPPSEAEDQRPANVTATNGKSAVVEVRSGSLKEQIDTLVEAGNKAIGLYFEDMHVQLPESRAPLVDMLRERGIEPGMRTGADYNQHFKGEAEYHQKLQWFLGQMLQAAEGGKTHHFDMLVGMAEKLNDLVPGEDLIGKIDRQLDRNERKLEHFHRRHKTSGWIERESKEAKALLTDNHQVRIKDLEGRQVEVLHRNKSGDYVEAKGTLRPHPEVAIFFTVEPHDAELSLNNVKAFYIEDTSPLTPQAHAKARQAAGDILMRSEQGRALFDSPIWLGSGPLDGWPITMLLPNPEKGQHELVEGLLRPHERGGALFNVETKEGLVEFNTNTVGDQIYLADRSPVTPAQFDALNQADGYTPFGNDQYKYDINILEGQNARLLLPNPKTHQYELIEGPIRRHERGGALFNVETSQGLRELHISEVYQQLFLGPNRPTIGDASAGSPGR